ncbi:L-rhamnose mutarotase [Sphingobium sp. Sx8-8]|uniref:L-rhamnose mutarotase n=1 Tax=Sphingobium sp. Sx8-8 TaxID=2933617 RepID=UPI001F585C78|nr:L-rhamnose mutarotase [Sphingobium sp. Sx8-8]
MARRICFALDLMDDAELIREYEARHRPGAVWPGVIANIRKTGFLAMEIWRVGDRMVMVAEVQDDWPRPLEASERMIDERWESAMDHYQKRLPFALPGEKWVPMTRLFSLNE